MAEIKPWKDTRAKIKSAKAKSLATTRKQFLWRAAHRSRAEALALSAPRYIGRPCKHGHNGERYTQDGYCVQCAREGAERTRRQRGADVRPWRIGKGRGPLRSAKRAAARHERAAL